MALALLSCPGEITFYTYGGSVARCSDQWEVLDAAQVISAGVNSSLPSPESMLLAFGAGLAVMLPLYSALWGIRAARESLNKS